MRKKTALDIFGGSEALAAELGITRQAVRQWPDELPDKHRDRLLGLALRKGKLIELIQAERAAHDL
jgi:hypothetical protein